MICGPIRAASGQISSEIGEVGRQEADQFLCRALLPSLDMEYYLCGPAPMMASVSQALLSAGVSSQQIKTEGFGPSSLPASTALPVGPDALGIRKITVRFARSEKTVAWTGNARSLLQLAGQNGIEISSGCLYGDCGTCMTPLLEGEVHYLHPTGAAIDPDACLPCNCKPKTSVVLDAWLMEANAAVVRRILRSA
jgi:uncharacterized protein